MLSPSPLTETMKEFESRNAIDFQIKTHKTHDENEEFKVTTQSSDSVSQRVPTTQEGDEKMKAGQTFKGSSAMLQQEEFSDTQSIFVRRQNADSVGPSSKKGTHKEYFISNRFAEKVFDQISSQQELIS